MLPGMYVVYQDRVCQVLYLRSAHRAPGQVGHIPTEYTLKPLDDPRRNIVLKDAPLAVDMPLTPACVTCGTRPGFSPCRGVHIPAQTSSAA